MKIGYIGLLIFFVIYLSACDQNEEKNVKYNDSKEELVQIEQNDEKTELSDNNLPLPVEDDGQNTNSTIEISSSIVSSFYKQKCASCHGQKGEISIKGRKLRDLNKEIFMQKMFILKNDSHHKNLSKEQNENLADFIFKGM